MTTETSAGALIQPIIMSGGAGTRLWPMSRAARPKQFLPLAGAETLFQASALRVDPSADQRFAAPAVIGGAAHARRIADELKAIGVAPAAIISEPAPRNTAAVAAVAALWAAAFAPGRLALLMPADQHIADAAGFRSAVIAGADAARTRIVTLGIKPTEPHTGFGYIECGAPIDARAALVAAFREKPDPATARAFLAGGRHYWNAGIFLFDPVVMLAELDAHAPAIRTAAEKALARARRDGARIDLDSDEFSRCPADSIDYAVMEKTDKAAVVGPLDIGWSDIGSWSALSPEDNDRIFTLDSAGALVRTDGPFVAVVGAPDMIVVATGDAVLVLPKDRAQDVKAIVEELKKRGRKDLL